LGDGAEPIRVAPGIGIQAACRSRLEGLGPRQNCSGRGSRIVSVDLFGRNDVVSPAEWLSTDAIPPPHAADRRGDWAANVRLVLESLDFHRMANVSSPDGRRAKNGVERGEIAIRRLASGNGRPATRGATLSTRGCGRQERICVVPPVRSICAMTQELRHVQFHDPRGGN
jgi:hypothetical protein